MAEAEGPQSCDTEVDFSEISHLCSDMPQPLLMTGVMINWMRMHFGSSSRINLEDLQDYIWTDSVDSVLTIESVYKYDAAKSEKRPGIFIKRNAWKVERQGIDDRKMLATNFDAWPQYLAFFKGSHTLFCVAGESAEAELLATEVYRELIMSGPRARQVFGLLRFVVTDIGEVSLLEEATENFVVPITVAYGGQLSWQICC